MTSRQYSLNLLTIAILFSIVFNTTSAQTKKPVKQVTDAKKKPGEKKDTSVPYRPIPLYNIALTDSTFEGWSELFTWQNTDVWKYDKDVAMEDYTVDKIGEVNFLFRDAKDYYTYTLAKVKQNRMVPVISGVRYLMSDVKGNVYARSETDLYRIEDTSAQLIYTGDLCKRAWVGADNNIYATRDVKIKNTTLEELLRLEKGEFKPILTNDKPLILPAEGWPKYQRWLVDAKGGVYCWHGADYKSGVYIDKWDGTSWVNIGSFAAACSFYEVDNDNNFYFGGGKLIMKWDGKQWTELPVPKDVNINAIYTQIGRDGKLYSAGADVKDATHEIVVRLDCDKWTPIAEAACGKHISFRDFIIAGNQVWNIYPLDHTMYYWSGWRHMRDSVAHIPVITEHTKPPIEYMECYLYKEGNNVGVTDSKGAILIHPYFDEILANEIGLLLRKGTDTTQVFFPGNNTYTRNDRIKGVKSHTGETCSVCKGAGGFESRSYTYQREIPGKWIPPKTYSGIAIGLNGYYRWSTTYPGYYEKSTYVTETKTIPARECGGCDGIGIFRNYEGFYYDPVAKVYVKSNFEERGRITWFKDICR